MHDERMIEAERLHEAGSRYQGKTAREWFELHEKVSREKETAVAKLEQIEKDKRLRFHPLGTFDRNEVQTVTSDTP